MARAADPADLPSGRHGAPHHPWPGAEIRARCRSAGRIGPFAESFEAFAVAGTTTTHPQEVIMRLRTLCCRVLAMLGVGAAMTGPALADECAPVRVGGDPTSLLAPWRQALDALVAATGREGRPWSCPDARVT